MIAWHRLVLGKLSTRRSWITNGMAGRAEVDRGRGLCAKWKSLCKPTWNHRERRNNSVEDVFQRFAWSFVSFLRRKHDFRRRIATFVWRILFEEPRIWTFGFNLRTRVLKSVTATQERLDMRSGCHAAKILPVGVRGTKNVWCLSSLMTRFNENSQLISLEKTLTYTLTISDFFVFWKSMLHPCLLRLRKKIYAGLLAAFKCAILTLWLWRAFTKILNWFHWRKR